jgi:hypothetical protein
MTIPSVKSLVVLFAGAGMFANSASGACFALKSPDRVAVRGNLDPIARFLAASDKCPADVFEFRAGLSKAGAQLKTSLVGNRGFHNPGAGSFSLFETVTGSIGSGEPVGPGEFFFGHFTAAGAGRKLFANQSAERENLMIELIAFDRNKGVFNFYEVIGDGTKGEWFYRGDSLDIVADIALLHRQPDQSRPQFGGRLRCSGCHIAGGPILKELAAPHNDWSTQQRPLTFGNLRPDTFLAGVFRDLQGPDELARSVSAGTLLLEQSEPFQKAKNALTFQEQLRPLFCPVELNLESDTTPLDEQKSAIRIPSAFFVNPRLGQDTIATTRAHYDAALTATKTKFPEISRADADHAWLAPVKAATDLRAIDDLVRRGVIDAEFAADVLAIDFTNPVFSSARCNLLRLVPSGGNLTAGFRKALAASSLPEAKQLLRNLDDPERTSQFHQTQAREFLAACRSALETPQGALAVYRVLAQRRAEAFASEISMNKRGQILEPGFRVVFPVVTPKATPGQLQLTAACSVQ